MKTAALILALMTVPRIWGGTITMDFTVSMDWRYDLSTNDFDPSFRPLTMNVRAIVDDQRTGPINIVSGSTRIPFGGVQINSALSGLVNMGYDVSTLTNRSTTVTVQDTFISPSNQGTQTNLYEQFSGNGVTLGRNLQYTNDPRLADPLNFGSTELLALLTSHLNKEYGYREDIVFPGGGFQHHGIATLTNVSFDGGSAVPEPSFGLAGFGALCILVLTRKKYS